MSPAATTTVMPSAAAAASLRSTSVRDAVYGRDGRLADAVGDRDDVGQRRAVRRRLERRGEQLEEAERRRRRRRPRRCRCTQRSKRSSCGATIETTMRVERALEDRLDARAAVDLQRGAGEAEAGAVLFDVRGGRRALADDRELHALAAEAGRLQRRDPVGGQQLARGRGPRCPRRSRGRSGPGSSAPAVPVRVGVPPSNGAAAPRRARRRGRRATAARGGLALLHGQPHAGDRVDVALEPLRQLGRVLRERDVLALGRRLVELPVGPEELLRLPDRHGRRRAQVGHVDRRGHVDVLERVLDPVADRLRGAPVALELREGRVLAVGRRRRVARRLHRAL